MNIAYFTSLFMVFLRVFAFFIALQVMFPKSLPNTVKVMLSLCISFFVMPYINLSQVSALNNGFLYTWQCICEILTGLILGFFANLMFLGVKIGGQFLDFQIGYSMMTAYDPTSESNASLIERFLNMFSVVLFFSIGGHEVVIKELVNSFNSVKLGTFVINDQSVMVAFNVFVQFFVIGFKIALPVVLVLLITDIVMGLMSRTVPQLNVMILGMPIKILLGLTCLMIILPLIAKVLITSFSSLPDIYKGFYKLVPIGLIFADSDKTEEATPKKKSEARKKGQVARSKEVPLAATLVVITFIISLGGQTFFNGLGVMMQTFFQSYIHSNLTELDLRRIIIFVILNAGKFIFMFGVPVMVVGIVANIAQTGWITTTEPIKPDLKKLNPISGFKRIFSMTTVVNLLKDLVVVAVLSVVGYKFLMSNYGDIANLNNLMVQYIPEAYLSYVVSIFRIVALIMIVIAGFDFVYNRYKYKKDMKMTKHEVKEEFKQAEGDPEIKGKRRQRMREIVTRTMLSKVPDATVVITNPTHISVAIKYERGVDKAPTVVAKGADRTALRIKEIAKENNVPIMENKPLARLIFKKVEVDEQIPAEMYQTVAEILALVYKLNKKQG
ncbi:flagellar biosynthesis protein FlhB [Clostridium acetobutylicum]|nr:flagellar biosynthesis protein FlhB [Clostridium acetobutylicum]